MGLRRRYARAVAPSPGCTSFVGYRVKRGGTERHGRPRRPCALVGAYAARPCALAAPCALSGFALGTAVSGYALGIFCRLPLGRCGGGLRRAAGVLGLAPCGSAPPAYARVSYLEPRFLLPWRRLRLRLRLALRASPPARGRASRAPSRRGPPPRRSALAGPPPLLAHPARYARARRRRGGLRESGLGLSASSSFFGWRPARRLFLVVSTESDAEKIFLPGDPKCLRHASLFWNT